MFSLLLKEVYFLIARGYKTLQQGTMEVFVFTIIANKNLPEVTQTKNDVHGWGHVLKFYSHYAANGSELSRSTLRDQCKPSQVIAETGKVDMTR